VIKQILTVAATALIMHSAQADVIVVQQQGLSFNPQEVTVEPGDTIRWVHNNGSHDVVHGLPCNAWEGSGYESPMFERMLLNSSNSVAEWVVPDAVYGEIPYFCSIGSHCAAGMTGLIKVVPPEDAVIHDVAQEGIVYIPEDITVSPGDIVRWTWGGGGHTVSSGSIDACTMDDLYFNLKLDPDHREVLWVVPEDMPQEIEYICDYHCFINHIGRIRRAPTPGDLDQDGSVNGADLTLLLGCWGTPCGDVNGDGSTDGSDLSVLLGNWTVGP